ncbi:hypothetical protein MPER_12287 [Moniliophthora perniciosa FA553]|nr:hypothetical protein MPER_12287 [Moniliophthora perniciosa FA553]
MSSATWRSGLTSFFFKETQRLAAEKRGLTALRYQQWEDGKGGEQVTLNPAEGDKPKKQAVV